MATGYAIKWLKNKLGISFFPITHLKAVRNDNNINLETLLELKLDELVSGTNIKTVNNTSILGSGNIEVPTKTSDLTNDSGFITSANIPDVSLFITKSVNDLVNYYTKSLTYTQGEVQQLINAVKQFTYELADTLPTASASTMHKIYLTPSSDPLMQNIKDEYITLESSGSYSWEQIGSTTIDLSEYVTTQALNVALDGYQTKIDSTHKLDYSLIYNTPTIPDVSGKADKVTNATNGNLAGLDANGNLTDSGKKTSDFVEGVSISGNKVRVTKNGNNTDLTVPYATKAEQDGDGNIISTNYLKLREPLMPTNTFSGDQSKFYLEPVMDCLWAADKRFVTSVTITDANQNVTTTTGPQLFRGNYSGTTSIKAGDNCTIKITIQANGNVETNYIATYVYGYLIVNFYYTGLPKSISGRIYRGTAGSKAWHNISFDKQKGDKNGIYISYIGANNYASIIELNIECQTLDTDPYMTMVSSIEWWNTRASVNQYPFVNKYTAQTLYYLLTANEGIIVPSGKTITIGGKDVLTDHQDISGKQEIIDVSHKLSADLVDDSSTINKFVTAAEKTTWNAKESTSNKVTSLSSSSTDTQYPSAKCVYDIVGDIETLINAL